MASITMSHVCVDFPVIGAGERTLQGRVLNAAVGGLLGRDEHRLLRVQALRDVSLSLGHGDRLAVVGRNGAGKSTLLRTMCGIFEPGAGSVAVSGRVSTLFDPALAMDPESTGREYVLLRGLYFGFARREILRRIDDIASFSQLGPYLSVPIKSYSTGMKLRLSFAASTWFRPDILLFDEMIAMMDAQFLRRVEERLKSFVSQAGIVVLASHSQSLVRELCNSAILIEHGRIVAEGAVDDVLREYGARGENPAA